MSVAPESPPHLVVLLVFTDFQLLDASGPADVFAAVGEHLPGGRAAPYRLRTVAPEAGLVASSTGLQLQAEALPPPSELVGCTLLVAGGHGVQRAMGAEGLVRWLAEVAQVARRCCSVCTGAFLLARAGLLDGRQVVTHWRYAALLQRLFPTVRVLEDALFVRDGAFYSSAGVTAGIDLCLSLVEEDLGRGVSLQVAKGLVMYLRRPGGQRQFSAELLAQQAPVGGLVEQLSAWLREHLQEDLDIEAMAAALAVSPRTLHRRCKEELDMGPARLLFQMRLEAACRLLEAGAASLKRTAQRTGFISEYNLRRAFVLELGVTPSEYRQRFCR
ncbi:helix-turn-helix domain-containing protein [Pseudomonas solani]|uniref:GlxA family transcriptional regulator n=1 Tax=Pseudomonas solani TaxID=2731552 RepID=UPI0035BE2679